MFGKILIANRGEIACRVVRTARRLGIATVAIYSEADAGAQHVRQADEGWPIGPPPARESYLVAERILDVARRSGAEAIHPGYGFLSENAAFAEACGAAGIVFVGPPPGAIRAMGDKSRAKALMARAGVPLIPGYHEADQDPDALRRAAREIGFPVLIKASAGGGGKGMRVVESEAEFAAELAGARREAASSFGDDRVLLEKYLRRARHVEVQVFADTHGHCLSLAERDCSIQRRHQKVVEEAPAPDLDRPLRRRMGAAAVAAARSVDYVGAGTVEFLLDPDGGFYFMEMNTRLQVEHPVTELVTGLDLVEWQLRVASGEALPIEQEQVGVNGHAIEARLYAEDPERDFLPSIGPVGHLRLPETGPHLRVDGGIAEGDRVVQHYDPMLAKLIVWDVDRDAAVRRLQRALAEVEVGGLATNAPFLAAIAGHPAFVRADLDTAFIARHAADLLPARPAAPPDLLARAALGVLLEREREARHAAAGSADPTSPWGLCNGWVLNGDPADLLILRDGETQRPVRVAWRKGGFVLEAGGVRFDAAGSLADGRLAAELDGVRSPVGFWRQGKEIWLFAEGRAHRLALVDPLPDEVDEAVTGGVTSPMPGTLTALLVAAGDTVGKGQPLAVIEAMKMEHTVKAPAAGTVTSVNFAVGALVDEGAALVGFTPEKAA